MKKTRRRHGKEREKKRLNGKNFKARRENLPLCIRICLTLHDFLRVDFVI